MLLGGQLARDDLKTVCFCRYVSGDEQCSGESGGFPRRLIDLGLDAPIERVRSRSDNSRAFARLALLSGRRPPGERKLFAVNHGLEPLPSGAFLRRPVDRSRPAPRPLTR